MSYSVSTGPDPIAKADIAEAIVAPTYLDAPDAFAATEAFEHLNVAREVAARMAEVLGRPDDPIVVNVSGHANPDHAPHDGYADECMTVSVTVRAKA